MRRAPKTDHNHKAIVTVLRQCGCSVVSLAAVGEGCPDLLVGRSGVNLLIEVKDGNKPPSHQKLNFTQTSWHHRWRGQVAVVRNADQAIDLVNGICARDSGNT